jgi:hypothetical protein
MLSEKAVRVLAALVYRPDAEWEVNIIPFGSIYWDDEMPAIGDLFDRPDDMSLINTIFGMSMPMP